MLDIELDIQYLSRLNDYPAKYVEQKLVVASGENLFKYIKAPGLLNSDLYDDNKDERRNCRVINLDFVANRIYW